MKKIVLISSSLFGILGLLKIFSIIPFNRMAADDFSSAIVARLGIWESLRFTYNNWIGRFSSILFETVIVSNLGTSGKITFYSFITFATLFFAFVIFFKRLLKLSFQNYYLYILSSVCISCLYELSPSKAESWYWLTGSATYLWPITFFLFASSYLLLPKISKLNYILSLILVFLTVAFNETVGFLVMIFYLAILLISAMQKRFKSLYLYSGTAATIAFAIMYFAPGNEIRRGSFGSNPMNFIGSIFYSLKEGPYELISMVYKNLYFLLPLTFMFTYLFILCNKNMSKSTLNPEVILTKIYLIIISSLTFSVFYMLPAFKNLGRIQPERSGVNLAFIIIAMVIGISYFVSQIIISESAEKRFAFKALIFGSAIFTLLGSYAFTKTLASDIYIARDYSISYDAMISDFQKRANEGNTEDVVVSLPDPGLVAITLDPPGVYDYKNDALSKFYNIGRVLTKKIESVEQGTR